MDEYINKQQLLEKVKKHRNSPFGVPLIIAEIENAKGVEVVRCRHCKHWKCKRKGVLNEYVGDCHNNDFLFVPSIDL